MSFILDALRKSETERQRQSTPGLVDAGYRPPARRRGPWLPVLIVVLAANLILTGYFWLRREAGPAPAVPAVVDGGARPDSGPPAVGGNRAALPGAADSAADSEFAAAADLPAVESEPVAGQSQPDGDMAAGPALPGEPHITDALPSADQLVASGAIPPQTLHLDIHVYSKVPAERFVFINMRKYGEGALLPEGAKIEEITRDGVVLSEAGQRFTLSRD